jgi:hypothetical protein
VAFRSTPLALALLAMFPTGALAQASKGVLPLPFRYCVIGAPLTATETLDYEPVENSSDPVRMHRDGTLYRDSEGRTRLELKYPDQPQPVSVFIQDCVAGFAYHWRVGDSVAQRETMKRRGHPYDTAAASKLDGGPNTLLIEGVPARHSYRTLKEVEGRVEQFTEYYYAPSLDLYLLDVFFKAGEGKSTSRIFDLHRVEPDPSLFQVPGGMTVKEDSPVPTAKSE